MKKELRKEWYQVTVNMVLFLTIVASLLTASFIDARWTEFPEFFWNHRIMGFLACGTIYTTMYRVIEKSRNPQVTVLGYLALIPVNGCLLDVATLYATLEVIFRTGISMAWVLVVMTMAFIYVPHVFRTKKDVVRISINTALWVEILMTLISKIVFPISEYLLVMAFAFFLGTHYTTDPITKMDVRHAIQSSARIFVSAINLAR